LFRTNRTVPLDVVYLKNGSILKGYLLEVKPDESVKLQTLDENIFVFRVEEIEKIVKEESDLRHPRNKVAVKGPVRGYRGFYELGLFGGVGADAINHTELNTSHGYQFNPNLFVGLGIGLHVFESEAASIPLYAHVRSEFVDRRITPFADVRLGYAFGDIEGLYFSPSVGVRFGWGRKSDTYVSLGYTLQCGRYEFYDFNWYEPQTVTRTLSLSGIGLRVGMSF
jgi:hypothetical protein